jgi:hypothetical protein
MAFPVVCGTSHNSSQLESYGHENLENPGLGNGPKFFLLIMVCVLIYFQVILFYMDIKFHSIYGGMWNFT